MTPLHMAVNFNNVAGAKALINNGVDYTIQSVIWIHSLGGDKLMSPEDYARYLGRDDILKLINTHKMMKKQILSFASMDLRSRPPITKKGRVLKIPSLQSDIMEEIGKIHNDKSIDLKGLESRIDHEMVYGNLDDLMSSGTYHHRQASNFSRPANIPEIALAEAGADASNQERLRDIIESLGQEPRVRKRIRYPIISKSIRKGSIKKKTKRKY